MPEKSCKIILFIPAFYLPSVLNLVSCCNVNGMLPCGSAVTLTAHYTTPNSFCLPQTVAGLVAREEHVWSALRYQAPESALTTDAMGPFGLFTASHHRRSKWVTMTRLVCASQNVKLRRE